jgi:FkbM family methyltransferase
MKKKLRNRLFSNILRVCGVHNIRDHSVLINYLAPNSLVIDAGSHLGQFARSIRQFSPSINISCIEANPRLIQHYSDTEIIEYNLKSGALIGEKPKSSKITFRLSPNIEASCISTASDEYEENLSTIEVNPFTLNDLIRGRNELTFSLLKMDIEGAETDVLLNTADSLIKKFEQISVEFHDHMKREQTADVDSAISHLKGLGFYTFVISTPLRSDVLFINQSLIKRLKSPSNIKLLLQLTLLRVTLFIKQLIQYVAIYI